MLAFYWTNNSLANDFHVFVNAGIRLAHSMNPYQVSGDPINQGFFNGPFHAIVLAIFSTLPFKILEYLLFFVSLLLIPFIVRSLHMLVFGYCGLRIYVFSFLIPFSFPFRAVFLYGQFTVIYFALFIWALRHALNSNSNTRQILIGVALGLCVDYKPHLYLIPLIFICHRKLWITSGFIFQALVCYVVFNLNLESNPYTLWINSLKIRSSTGFNGKDLMGIYALFGLNSLVLTTVSCILIGAIIYIFTKIYRPEVRLFHVVILINFACWLFQPFIHPQDLVWAGFLLPLLYERQILGGYTNLFAFISGMLFVWSYHFLPNLFVSILLFSILRFFGLKYLFCIFSLVPVFSLFFASRFTNLDIPLSIKMINYVTTVSIYLLLHKTLVGNIPRMPQYITRCGCSSCSTS